MRTKVVRGNLQHSLELGNGLPGLSCSGEIFSTLSSRGGAVIELLDLEKKLIAPWYFHVAMACMKLEMLLGPFFIIQLPVR